MNVLAIGAGLVGCNFAREMKERGHNVVLYDLAPNEAYIRNVAGDIPVVRGNMQDLSALVETMQEHKIETVFQSAFLIGQPLMSRPYDGVRSNVNGSLAVIEAIRLTGARRLIFAGTFGVYHWDLDPKEPIKEDFPVIGGHFYLSSKLASEYLLGAFATWYNIEFATVRFAQIYGYGHYAGGDMAGPAMHEVLTDALAGNQVTIDPGVLSYNDYIYAKDVGHGVALACEKPLNHQLYHLGSGRLSSPDDVALAIQEVVPGAKVEVLKKPVVGPFWRHEQILDLTRVRDELGYEPQYDLPTGLRLFVDDLKLFG
jgi:UDP-glucose 4-epimerase